MLILYSVAPLDVRQQIDDLLFVPWCRYPCSIDRDSPLTAQHRLAVQRLHSQHLVGRALTKFAMLWGMVQEKSGR